MYQGGTGVLVIMLLMPRMYMLSQRRGCERLTQDIIPLGDRSHPLLIDLLLVWKG